MSYNVLLHIIQKGGTSSGNFAHAGRPGKIGGSTTVGVPGGLVPGLPGGAYNAVYSTVFNKQTAINRAAKLGPGHVIVRIAGQYHVIDTGDPTIQAPGIHYLNPAGAKIAAGVTAYWQGQSGQPQLVLPPAAAPVALPSSKVEEHYINASLDAQEYARKYGILAQDENALNYLKEMEASNTLTARNITYDIDNNTHRNRMMVDASFDGTTHDKQQKALDARNAAGLTNSHVTKRLEDPLGRGHDGYVIVPKGTKIKDLPVPDLSVPDYTRMASLKSQTTKEVAAHQSHMDQKWNMHDNGVIQAKINNAFEITMPADLHDSYQTKRTALGNTKFLYHGTSPAGSFGLARNGYFRGDVARIGRIHGNGTYMADQESKAAQYAHNHTGSKYSNSRGVIVINQAALGRVHEDDDHYNALAPYSEDLKSDIDTLKINPSMGSFVSGNPFQSTARSNEYIVKDPGALQPRIWLDITRSPR